MAELWKGEIESWRPDRRLAHNLARLAGHVERVRARSPWYRERLGTGRIDSAAALAELPVITKSEVIADQSADPPYGTLIAVPTDQVVRIYVGAGPQATYMTRSDYALTSDNAAWAFFTNGFRNADRVDNTIMYHWVIAGTVIDEGLRSIGCAVIPGGIGNAQTHLENMRWTKATGMFIFPTFLEELAAKAVELGIDVRRDLHLRLTTISGEMRSDQVMQQQRELWGMELREIYGGAEVPFMAAECSAGGGMHVNPDFHVEFLHPETRQPVGPGEPAVPVISELGREAYPMIRYWTGDICAGYRDEPCSCGRTTARMGRILGRVGDIPRVKGLFVVPKQVRASLDRVGGLGRFQLVIDRPDRQDHLTVRVESEHHREADIIQSLKDGIRLTCAVELLAPGTLAADAPVVVDRRRL
jgi:phenylacetate-CoA ligase